MIVIRNHHICYPPYGCTSKEVDELDRHLDTGLLVVASPCAVEVRKGAQEVIMDVTVGRGDWHAVLKSDAYRRYDTLYASLGTCITRCVQMDEEGDEVSFI